MIPIREFFYDNNGLFSSDILLAVAVTLFALSIYLLLPKRGRQNRNTQKLGWFLGFIAIVISATTTHRLNNPVFEILFLTIILAAIISGVVAITRRSPIYATLWFTICSISTSCILVCLGSYILGIAILIINLAAALLTFGFIFKLNWSARLSPSDLMTNEPLLSTVAGALLLGLFLLSIERLPAEEPLCCRPPSKAAALGGRNNSEAKEESTHRLNADGFDQFFQALSSRYFVATGFAVLLFLLAIKGSTFIASSDTEATSCR